MMLTKLVEYANREGLGDLDFEARPVDYELRIDKEGRFLGLVPLAHDGERPTLPHLPIGPKSKNNPGYPSFLVDNAQYVLGTPKKGAKEGNAERCRQSYAKLVAHLATASGDAALRALEKFVDQAHAKERRRADDELAKLVVAASAKTESSRTKTAAPRGLKPLHP